jgi:orotidine-5'-phosphate decarboxylase
MPDGSGFPVARVRDVPSNMAERLIVALDFDTVVQAKELVRKLDGIISFFKIGFRLQMAAGYDDLITTVRRR